MLHVHMAVHFYLQLTSSSCLTLHRVEGGFDMSTS